MAPRHLRREDRLDPLAVVLFLLVAADLAFVAMFGMLAIGVTADKGFTLTYDRSYAEVFQYVKQYWIVLLLLGLAWRRRTAIYATFAGLFGFFLVDDYAELHERWGESLAETLHIPAMWMLQPYDFGELIVFAAYAVVAGLAVITSYRIAAKVDRLVVWELFQLLALVGLFAVGIDVLHALALPELISNSIGAVEDGGEMVAFSLIVWRLLGHAIKALPTTPAAECVVEESEDAPLAPG